jgi:hypothetical protein
LTIHQDAIERLPQEKIERLPTIARDRDIDTSANQQVDREFLIDAVILDEKDSRPGQASGMAEPSFLT